MDRISRARIEPIDAARSWPVEGRHAGAIGARRVGSKRHGSSNRSPQRPDPGQWPARLRRRSGRRQAHDRGRGSPTHVQVRARAAVHARRGAGGRGEGASVHPRPRHDVGTAEPSPRRGVPRPGPKAPAGRGGLGHRRQLGVRIGRRHPGDDAHVDDDAGQVPGAQEPRQARRGQSRETRKGVAPRRRRRHPREPRRRLRPRAPLLRRRGGDRRDGRLAVEAPRRARGVATTTPRRQVRARKGAGHRAYTPAHARGPRGDAAGSGGPGRVRAHRDAPAEGGPGARAGGANARRPGRGDAARQVFSGGKIFILDFDQRGRRGRPQHASGGVRAVVNRG